MSSQANVLFDAPGPKTVQRNRMYSVVGGLFVAAVVGYVIWRLYDTDQFEARKWEIFQYANVQQELFDGLVNTLTAFLYAGVLSIVLGALLAVGQLSDHRIVRIPCITFVQFFRAMPLLVLVFFFYLANSKYQWGYDVMWTLVAGLTLYNGAVQAETIRSGILAVPKGQSEAAYAIGLRKTQVMTLVLIPQAVRAMLPNIISQLVVTLKDTSLGYLIGYTEFLYLAKRMAGDQDFGQPFIPMVLVIAPIYIGLCMALSYLAIYIERRAGRSRKGKPATVAPTLDIGGT